MSQTKAQLIDNLVQPITGALGSASAPTFSFTADPNTGLFSPGADQLSLSTGGTGRLFINSTGQTSLGTASALSGATLTIAGNCLAITGQNLAHSANSLRMGEEGSGLAELRAYGPDVSTAGSFRFRVSRSDGSNSSDIVIDSSGRLGIGTSSPGSLLHIGGNNGIRFGAGGTPEAEINYTSAGSEFLDLKCRGTNNTVGNIRFFTGNTSSAAVERMIITSAGNVGIGTTSPGSELVVTKSSGNVRLTVQGGTNGDGTLALAGAGTGIGKIAAWDQLVFGKSSAGAGDVVTEWGRWDSSGRLLVGTSTARSNFFNTSFAPTVQIETATSSNRGLSIINNSSADTGAVLILGQSRGDSIGSNTALTSGREIGQIDFQGNDGADFVAAARIEAYVDGTPGANDMPGRLVFSTTADGASSPTERARITSNGHFKATTDNSYATMDADAHGFRQSFSGNWTLDTCNTSASPFGIQIEYLGASPNGASNAFFAASDTTTNRAVIRSNGGFANFQANDINLSDRNLKKDITPAAGTWDCIKEWEIVNYRYKDQPDDADLNLGVIAQQVAENCPEVVTVFQEATEDQPEKLGIKEQQMYWMAIKALQEAQVRIEALEAEVAVLKAQ